MPTDPRNALIWRPLERAGRTPVLLIRHGQTAWNAQRRFLGQSDIPLDEVGTAQAATLARWLRPLPFQALHSSPLARAWQTAEAVGEGRPHGPPIPAPGLAELNQGELEGLPGSALPERFPTFLQAWIDDPENACVPGGETLGRCRDRAVEALENIAGAYVPGPPVAVVAHKMVISTLVCTVLDLPLRHYTRIGQGNTAVNLLSRGRQGDWALHRLNETGHLD